MKTTILLLISFVAISCSQNDTPTPDTLPAITQTGANTAGCLINGQVLMPKDGSQAIGGPPAFGLIISRLYGSFRLDIKNYKYAFFHLYIKKLEDNKFKYNIEESDGEFFEPHSNNSESQLCVSYNNKVFVSSSNSGIINITNNSYPIISGTFTAILYNKDNPSEKINLTDGSFDINVSTLNK